MKPLILTIFLFSSLFFFCAESGAQEYVVGMEEYINYSNITRSTGGANNRYVNMKGTPFLNEDFQEGKLTLNNGKVYQGPLRYDIYSDDIEFRTTDDLVYGVKNPETIKKVQIGDCTILYFERSNEQKLQGFYQVLVNGKYTLMEKHRVYLKDAEAAKPYVEAKPAEFIKKKSEYWVINTEGVAVTLEGKKQALLLDPQNADAIANYIKKNRLKLSKREDLVKFISYMNE